MLIHQIKLRTFFTLIYLSVIIMSGGYFFYAYNQYKEHLAESISKEILALHNGMEKIFNPIINADLLHLIDPILNEVPKNRSFVETISLSLNNETILSSSDKRQISKTFLTTKSANKNNIAADILSGETYFLMPLTYYHGENQMIGSLLITINQKAVSSNLFLQEIYTSFMISTICIVVLISIILFMIHKYLILPLHAFEMLTLDRKREKASFFISDLANIYNHISDSYDQLDEKERSLENALYIKDYLNNILHTIDSVEHLLISDKSIQEIMDESCKLLSKHGQYNLTWIGNIVDDRIEIVAHSDDSTGYVKQLNLSLNPNDPTSKGPSAQSTLTNKTIVTQSVNMQYYSLWRDKAKDSGIGSSICLPLRGSANEKPFATLAIYSSKPFGFLDEEITMLEDLAGDLGYSIVSRIKKEELQVALTTDSLTGLSNRILLLKRIHDCKNPRLLLININRFRDINTVYGFDAGDFILRSYAKYLSKEISEDFGHIFKLHSDTFAILFEKSYPSQSIETFIQKVSLMLAEHPFSYNGIEIWITIAAGYSDTTEQTIENAEIALKIAKDHKVLFQQFDQSMRSNKEHEENIAWYKIIKDAIKYGQLVPFYQPIVSNESGKIVKYEALARIVMDDGSIIPPFKFLDIAKKTGLYPQLTRTIVEKTIATFRELPYRVSLNLSTEDITNTDMVSFLRESIINSSIGNKIIFEILESEGVDNYDLVSEFISDFKQLGCQFAIDDFGSGFSNFEHLIKLHVDFLKIDGSLIKNLPNDRNARVIVKNIQNFASEMGIATIAEFVGSKEIADIVKSMGITYSQGYYFSEPSKEILINLEAKNI